MSIIEIWLVAVVLGAALVVSLLMTLLRRRRRAQSFGNRQRFGRALLALLALPPGFLPGELVTRLQARLERLARDCGTGAEASAGELLEQALAAQRRSSASLSLTKQHRSSAREAVASLLAVVRSLQEGSAAERAVHWQCEAGLTELLARLRADELEHEALSSGHLGDRVRAAQCYRGAQELLQSCPRVARPFELEALASRLAAA